MEWLGLYELSDDDDDGVRLFCVYVYSTYMIVSRRSSPRETAVYLSAWVT